MLLPPLCLVATLLPASSLGWQVVKYTFELFFVEKYTLQKIHSAKNTFMSGSNPLASLLIRMTPISAQWRITINTSSPTSYILNWCTFQETNAKNTKYINAEKYKDITTTKTVPRIWCCTEQESCELCNIWSKFKFDNFWPIF